jgi:hypothetical protein
MKILKIRWEKILKNMKKFDFLSEGISLTTYWNPEPLKTSFLMSHRFMIIYGFYTSLLGYNLVRVKNVVYYLIVWLSWNCIVNGSKISDQVLGFGIDWLDFFLSN